MFLTSSTVLQSHILSNFHSSCKAFLFQENLMSELEVSEVTIFAGMKKIKQTRLVFIHYSNVSLIHTENASKKCS